MTSFINQFQRLSIQINAHQRNIIILICVWVIAMISVPIQKWIWGDSVIPAAITFGLVAQFVAVSYIVASAWGINRTLITFATVAIMTWLAEYIGSSTGIPFGEYTYTDTLQPQLAHVPIIIPIAWFMMLPSAWVIAQTLTQTITSHPIVKSAVFAMISAVSFTAWDLFLDPQMVAWGFWEWSNPIGYFGIPWINYVGWVGTALIVTVVVRPRRLPVFPLLVVYGVVWFLQSFGQFFFWGQQGPAIVGFFVMGFFLLITIIKYHGQDQ